MNSVGALDLWRVFFLVLPVPGSICVTHDALLTSSPHSSFILLLTAKSLAMSNCPCATWCRLRSSMANANIDFDTSSAEGTILGLVYDTIDITLLFFKT